MQPGGGQTILHATIRHQSDWVAFSRLDPQDQRLRPSVTEYDRRYKGVSYHGAQDAESHCVGVRREASAFALAQGKVTGSSGLIGGRVALLEKKAMDRFWIH